MVESASGFLASRFDSVEQGVQVGLALAAALNGQPAFVLQRFDRLVDRGSFGPHFLRHAFLAGKHFVVMPGVA